MLSRIAPRRIPQLCAACTATAPSPSSSSSSSSSARRTPALVGTQTVSQRWNTPAPPPPKLHATEPLIPAPSLTANQPLMSRRSDRELPDVEGTQFRWTRTFPLFVLAMVISTLAIINYQKSSSSTVAAILYALRTNDRARALLGDEVYFAHRIPWISGQMAQLQGVIDISFRVRGSRGEGTVRFHSTRKSARAVWETREYWVEVGGQTVDLLDEESVFEPIVLEKGELDEVKTRGFRK